MSFFVTRPPRAGALDWRSGRRRARTRCGRRPVRRRCGRCRTRVRRPGRAREEESAVSAGRSRSLPPRMRRPRPAWPARAAPPEPPRVRRPRARSPPARCRRRPSRPPGRGSAATTPSAGLGTSVSTLSVEISSNGSSRPIGSPSDLSHFVIVPSETDTPIWGMTTSVCVPVDICSPSTPRAL